MKIGLTIFSALFISSLFAKAQCEMCSSIPGEIIDYCYTEAGLDGRCASFTESSVTFHYEDKARKKPTILKFMLPENHGAPSSSYLLGLATDKKLKLTAADLLFIEHAITSWNEVDGVSRWAPSVVNSGYTILPSGLAYKVIKAGQGKTPVSGNSVTVHYTGYLSDGKKFDNSLDRKQTYRFVLGKGQVIKGWEEGVALMPIGSRYLLRVPAELAAGSRGEVDMVPSNATLYFDVQLLAAE